MDRGQRNGHRARAQVVANRLVWAEIISLLSYFWLLPSAEEYQELSSHASFNNLRELISTAEVNPSDQERLQEQVDLLENSFLPYPQFYQEAQRLLSLSYGSQAAPCIESIYKPWTADKTCSLPIAHQTGYIMGDSALHMQSLLAHLELEQPHDLMPDHLSVELGVFSVLLEHSTIASCIEFIHDHLDWLNIYRDALSEKSAPEFYVHLADLTEGIVVHLTRWLEGEDHNH